MERVRRTWIGVISVWMMDSWSKQNKHPYSETRPHLDRSLWLPNLELDTLDSLETRNDE